MEEIRAGMAELQDRLTGALIGIARAVSGNEHLICDSTDELVREGLAAALPNAGSTPERMTALLRRAEEEKRKLVPMCYECASPCGKNNNYDMRRLGDLAEDICSLKLLILCGIRSMAACACRAAALGRTDREADRFFYEALFAVGEESLGMQELLPIAARFGAINLRCMALLDRDTDS